MQVVVKEVLRDALLIILSLDEVADSVIHVSEIRDCRSHVCAGSEGTLASSQQARYFIEVRCCLEGHTIDRFPNRLGRDITPSVVARRNPMLIVVFRIPNTFLVSILIVVPDAKSIARCTCWIRDFLEQARH